MMMEDGIEMETIFGDGSNQASGSGLMGKLFSAGKLAEIAKSYEKWQEGVKLTYSLTPSY